jgi:P-type conjugative transfer protein TrbJ
MLKKTGKLLLPVVLALLILVVPMACADLPVIDMTAVANLTQQLAQWQQELAYWQQQLAQVDPANTAQILTTVQQIKSIQSQINGLLADYKAVQEQWDSTFQDYSTWSGKTGGDYVSDLNAVVSQTKQSQKNALAAQGLVSQTADDQDTLGTLLQSSQNATGTVQVQQTANQLIALEIQQIIRLQQMLSSYNQSQLQYLRTQQQNADRYNSATQPSFTDKPDFSQPHQGGVNPNPGYTGN